MYATIGAENIYVGLNELTKDINAFNDICDTLVKYFFLLD